MIHSLKTLCVWRKPSPMAVLVIWLGVWGWLSASTADATEPVSTAVVAARADAGCRLGSPAPQRDRSPGGMSGACLDAEKTDAELDEAETGDVAGDGEDPAAEHAFAVSWAAWPLEPKGPAAARPYKPTVGEAHRPATRLSEADRPRGPPRGTNG